MKSEYVNIGLIFEEITAKVSARVLPKLQEYNDKIVQVSFFDGHVKQMSAELDRRDKAVADAYKLWPMIGLFRDFEEQVGELGLYSNPTVTLIIAKSSKLDYTSRERQLYSFEPVLYPVYFALLDELKRDKRVEVDYKTPHRKIDHYLYGAEENANVFNMFTDSIEIRDLQVKIKLIC